ncbi:AAEL004754-PA [Aedes aegypti]|uniref:AAEL004754-PA n=1 Tax=Aedes aegypti TaxID=7159 RepID=Q17BZ7_AEDAE|nr:AAEL004754-PA [Aedes aegypti]
MAFEFILFASLLVAVRAGFSHQTISQRVPSSYYSGRPYAVEESGKPIYIGNDEIIKHQHEAHRLDMTRGQYRLVDPDGKLRLINYHGAQRARSNNNIHHRAVEPRQYYKRPVQASNLHTVPVETPVILRRQASAPIGARILKSHSIPKSSRSQSDIPVSYVSISQVLPTGNYGQKELRTTSHASQHPY